MPKKYNYFQDLKTVRKIFDEYAALREDPSFISKMMIEAITEFHGARDHNIKGVNDFLEIATWLKCDRRKVVAWMRPLIAHRVTKDGKKFGRKSKGSEYPTHEKLVEYFKNAQNWTEINVTSDNDINFSSNESRFVSNDLKEKVWRRDQGKCAACGSKENLEYDHIIPHSKGGKTTYTNLQLLCKACNQQKADKYLYHKWK